MSDEITFAGKPYVSSKRASKISGYAQDYIGQLSRSGQIEAQRIGGLWYVSMDSLLGYRKEAPLNQDLQTLIAVPSGDEQPPLTASADVDSFVSFDGKDYISASRASKVTGYNQDYVGQLARSGQILARQVGNRWYVDRVGIINHKNEKDALLAAVQAESVGIPEQVVETKETGDSGMADSAPVTEMKYYPDKRDLMPTLQKAPQAPEYPITNLAEQDIAEENPIPIRLIKQRPAVPYVEERRPVSRTTTPRRGSKMAQTAILATAALTVVIVLSFGVASLRSSSTYVLKPLLPSKDTFMAAASQAFDTAGSMLERLVSSEIIYTREK